MTAAVKAKGPDKKSGILNVTYLNETGVRNCTEMDFNKTTMYRGFRDLSIYKNLYCPDSYENVTLATQRLK